MATSIQANKQSVKQLLETGKVNKFIIPEYQRPYAWTDEQIQTLFEDLTEYTGNNNEDTYFLGTIVSYENDNGEQEIIDGQQRITSLFLLLRALYSKLNSMTETKEVANFKVQIESALWEQDELTAEVNLEKVLIESRVISDEGNKIFGQILVNGTTEETAKDNYSLNYKLLKSLLRIFLKIKLKYFFSLLRIF